MVPGDKPPLPWLLPDQKGAPASLGTPESVPFTVRTSEGGDVFLVSTRGHLKTSTYRKWFLRLGEMAVLHHCHREVKPSHSLYRYSYLTGPLLLFHPGRGVKTFIQLKGENLFNIWCGSGQGPLTAPRLPTSSTAGPAPHPRPREALLNLTHALVHRTS